LDDKGERESEGREKIGEGRAGCGKGKTGEGEKEMMREGRRGGEIMGRK